MNERQKFPSTDELDPLLIPTPLFSRWHRSSNRSRHWHHHYHHHITTTTTNAATNAAATTTAVPRAALLLTFVVLFLAGLDAADAASAAPVPRRTTDAGARERDVLDAALDVFLDGCPACPPVPACPAVWSPKLVPPFWISAPVS